jgi:hypothetical protein
MKGICIIIAAAILVLSLASAVEANTAADPTTPNFEEASGPLDATDQPLPQAVPGKATLVGPTGTISTRNPDYNWNAVSGSTWYYLWIDGPSGNVLNQWYTAAEVTFKTNCGVTPFALKTLVPGTYTWWIQTWNNDGAGPWSDPMSFTVPQRAGFVERFDGATLPSEWVPVTGLWNVGPGYLQSHPMPVYGWESIKFDAPDYTNFEFGVTISRSLTEPLSSSTPNAFGIYVRGNPSTLSQYGHWSPTYLFVFKYLNDVVAGITLFKIDASGNAVGLGDWTTTGVIRPRDAWNKFKVSCTGSSLALSINDQLIWSGTDSTFTSGKVGLCYHSSTGGADFKVEEAQLTPLAAGATVTGEISPEQQKLNEEAMLTMGSGQSSDLTLPIQER